MAQGLTDYRGTPLAVDDRIRIPSSRTRRGVPAYLGNEEGVVTSIGRINVTVLLDRYPDKPFVVPADVVAKVG